MVNCVSLSPCLLWLVHSFFNRLSLCCCRRRGWQEERSLVFLTSSFNHLLLLLTFTFYCNFWHLTCALKTKQKTFCNISRSFPIWGGFHPVVFTHKQKVHSVRASRQLCSSVRCCLISGWMERAWQVVCDGYSQEPKTVHPLFLSSDVGWCCHVMSDAASGGPEWIRCASNCKHVCLILNIFST